MSNSTTAYVGLDVDAKFIHVAMLLPGESTPVEWRVAHEDRSVRRLAKRPLKAAGEMGLHACYEAGPTGSPFSESSRRPESCVTSSLHR